MNNQDFTINQRRKYFNQTQPEDRWMWAELPNAEIYKEFFAKLTFKQIRALEVFYEATNQLAEAEIPFCAMDFDLIFQLDVDYKNRERVVDLKEPHFRLKAESFTDCGGF